jgi:outer membrane murein-binding lipoprotein Lpp
MVDRAAGILEEAGLGAAESTKERMARTLMATASDPSAEEALRHGRLTSELEPSGFGEVALTASLADGPKPPRTKKADARLAALTDEVATLEEEVTALEKDAKEARRQADQAQRAADSARRRLDQKKEQMAKARAAARS